MKREIYNKKSFYGGLISLLLSLMTTVTIIIKFNNLDKWNFIKLLIGGILCLLLGLTEVYRSLNNECTMEDKKRDEREIPITLKSKSKAFDIIFSSSFIIIIICLIFLALTENYLFTEIIIGVAMLLMIMTITEIITYYYYKRHN